MKLRDFLNEEEHVQWRDLELELLQAPNKLEREYVKAKMEELINTARERYYAHLANNEQSSTYEHTKHYA